MTRRSSALFSLAASLLCLALPQTSVGDPLPSWNDGAARRAILDFVARVTNEGGADYVPPSERVATFDNDSPSTPSSSSPSTG